MSEKEKITFKRKLLGWQMKIPHHLVQSLNKNSDIVDAISAGAGIAGIALPVVGIIAAYIQLQLVLIKRLDKGKGVYITKVGSSLILIPSTVK